MIQMFVQQGIEGISSRNKESEAARGKNSVNFVVIRFGGVFIPTNIENIPSLVFGRDEDQYALTASAKGEFAMFFDTTMGLYMYVIAKKQSVYVLFPFSQPAYPVDSFLDLKVIGEKIVRYAQKVNPDYPLARPEYIQGFTKVQSEVDAVEQRAINKFQTGSGGSKV